MEKKIKGKNEDSTSRNSLNNLSSQTFKIHNLINQ